ncbi:hypothetical protein F443_11650, partial [Phytophthora nicotianae P1569]
VNNRKSTASTSSNGREELKWLLASSCGTPVRKYLSVDVGDCPDIDQRVLLTYDEFIRRNTEATRLLDLAVYEQQNQAF